MFDQDQNAQANISGADFAIMCDEITQLRAQVQQQAEALRVAREALKFYADQEHFIIHDRNAWDTVSGEPINLWEDESNTATVEDGSIAKAQLAAIDALPTVPAQDALTEYGERVREAKTAMENAKNAKGWDDVPFSIHSHLDELFAAVSAMPLPKPDAKGGE